MYKQHKEAWLLESFYIPSILHTRVCLCSNMSSATAWTLWCRFIPSALWQIPSKTEWCSYPAAVPFTGPQPDFHTQRYMGVLEPGYLWSSQPWRTIISWRLLSRAKWTEGWDGFFNLASLIKNMGQRGTRKTCSQLFWLLKKYHILCEIKICTTPHILYETVKQKY